MAVTANTGLIVAALMVGYLLSPPFVVKTMITAGMTMGDLDGDPFLNVFYMPARYLFDNCPPYEMLIVAEHKMLGN